MPGWQPGHMTTKRSLKKAEVEQRARAKRLDAMGSNGGLFIGAMLGALYAAPRINDWASPGPSESSQSAPWAGCCSAP